MNMHRGVWGIGLLFFFPFAALTAMADEPWQAGVASVDITPTYPVRLSGYGSRTTENEGVSQRLHAKALALYWKQEPPVLILTVDNCGVPAAVRQKILDQLRKTARPITSDRLSIHSSHTHCAPVLRGGLPFLFAEQPPPDQLERIDKYTEDLISHLVSIASQALQDPRPAQLTWDVGTVRFASNRRLPGPSGFTNAPNPYGPVDHALPVLRVASPDGKPMALLASYACHCTTLAINQTHADWAGCAREELELRFPGAIAMIAIGCGGDQNPYPRRELAHARNHGVTLAKEVVRLIGTPMTPVSGPIQTAFKEIMLPFEGLPPKADLEKAKAGSNKPAARRADHYLNLLAQGGKAPPALPYMMQTFAFHNDLLMINLAGEVVVDYSLRFKKTYDVNRTWVNAYTNDVPCYIPSQRVWEEGGYEAADAMIYYGHPSRFATGTEDLIARNLDELVPATFRAQPTK